MITKPINMSLHDWTDQVITDVEHLGPVGKMLSDDWQQWGSQLINNTGLRIAPNPYLFDDWQLWGFRLCEQVLN